MASNVIDITPHLAYRKLKATASFNMRSTIHRRRLEREAHAIIRNLAQLVKACVKNQNSNLKN